MNPVNFVFHLIAVGATLLCAGTLVEIVVDLQKKAAHDTKVGIISIGGFNRQLYKEGNPKKHPRSRPENEESRVKRSIENL